MASVLLILNNTLFQDFWLLILLNSLVTALIVNKFRWFQNFLKISLISLTIGKHIEMLSYLGKISDIVIFGKNKWHCHIWKTKRHCHIWKIVCQIGTKIGLAVSNRFKIGITGVNRFKIGESISFMRLHSFLRNFLYCWVNLNSKH